MKTDTWKDITEESKQTGSIGTVTMMVKKFGLWTLGYQWVDVSLGKAITTGLALYAQKGNREPKQRITFSLKESIGFFADLKAPPKAVALVLRKAESEGNW